MNDTYNPWKDIVPYTIDDSHSFRGRDEEKRDFLRMMGNADFSVLYAQSGIGKTSFINAGLYPELKKKGFLFIRIVFPTDILTSNHDVPYEFFEKWFKEQIFKQIPDDIHKSHKNPHNDDILTSSLWWNLHSIELIENLPDFPTKTIKPYLIFDQFEEVFQKANKDNLCAIFTIIEELTGERPPEKIINAIEKNEEEGIYLSYNQGVNYKILFSLRKEYLADFDYWTNEMNSIPQLLRNRMLLLPFTEEQAKEVITQQTHDGKRISVFDNVVNAILTLFKNRNIQSRDSRKYEAFLLSVVCSRLYLISNALGNKLLSSDEVKRIDLDKLLLDFYDERITNIGIPIKHLKIIENELIDDFGERNRVNVNAIKLSAIDFQSKYEKQLEDAHLIRWSSDGYIELVHDKIAELINHRRKQKRLHSWNVVQRISICALLVLSVIAIVRLGWSTAHGEEYDYTQENIKKYDTYKASKTYIATKATWPNDFKSTVIANTLNRILEIDTDKTVKDSSNSIYINSCPFVEEIRIKGKGQQISYINISDCNSLSLIALSDSINYIPVIDNCPKVHYIKLPEQYKNKYSGIHINSDSNFTIDVPEKLNDNFKWHENALWDTKKKQICFVNENVDSVILFPQELRALDTLRFNGRLFYNGAKRNKPFFRINGATLEKVDLFDMKDIHLNLMNDKRTRNLKKIGAEAFANCNELVSVILPDSLTTIEDCAFWQCSKLRSIEFSKELTGIKNFAFYGCSKIDSLYLPEKLSYIGYSSFAMCKNLRAVRLPSCNVIWNTIQTTVPMNRKIFEEATAFDGCNNINVFYRNDSTFLTNLHIIKENSVYVYYNLSNNNNLPDGFIIKDSTLYYRFNGLNSIVSYKGTKEVYTNNCVYNPKGSSFVVKSLFRGDLSRLHNIHFSGVHSNYSGCYIPNILAKELNISVPYHCRKNYIGLYHNSFKTIKEDSFSLRVWNQFRSMYSNTIFSSQYFGIFTYIGLLLVLSVVSYIIYRKVKRTLPRLNAIIKTILSVFCFLFIWIVSYWPIFFLWIRTGLGGNYTNIVGMILGLLLGIIIALLFTWMLVFDTKTDVFVMLSKIWFQIRSITLNDIKWSKIARLHRRLISRIKSHKLISLLILTALVIATIVLSLWYNRLLIEKESFTKQDLTKMSICIIRTPKQKRILSERICKDFNINNIGEKRLKCNGHSARVNYVSFSPNDSIIASASDDGSIKLWQIGSYKEIRAFYHDDCVNSVSFSQDGKSIISASDDKTAIVWNVENGKMLRTLQHDVAVKFSLFCPDGRYAVTASDYTVKLWDTITWNAIFEFNTEDHWLSMISSISFSSDSKLIAISSYSGTVSIWDVNNRQKVKTFKYNQRVNSAEFSHNSQLLLVTTDDEIILKNIVEDTIEKRINWDELAYWTGDIKSATFSQDDSQILVLRKYSIEVLDLYNNKNILTIRDDYVPYTTFDHKSQHIVTTSKKDGYIRYWDINNSQIPIWQSEYTYYNDINYYCNEKIAILRTQDSVEVWNTKSSLNKIYAFKNSEPWAISNNGSLLIMSSRDSIELIQTKNGDKVWSTKNTTKTNSFEFSPNNCTILVQSRDTTSIMDIANGSILRTYKNYASKAYFSPEGNYIASIEGDNITLWDNNGKRLYTLPHNNSVRFLMFSPTGKILLGFTYNTMSIWDTSTGTCIKEVENRGIYSYGERDKPLQITDSLIIAYNFAYNFHNDVSIKFKNNYSNIQLCSKDKNVYASSYGDNTIYSSSIEEIMDGMEFQECYKVQHGVKKLSMIRKNRFIYISINNVAFECRVLSLNELIQLTRHRINISKRL